MLAPLFLAGCVTPQDMEAMRSDINRLQIQVAGLQDNLNKTNQELQASVVQGNQQLRAQNREIQSKVEEIASASDVVKKNQADISIKTAPTVKPNFFRLFKEIKVIARSY